MEAIKSYLKKTAPIIRPNKVKLNISEADFKNMFKVFYAEILGITPQYTPDIKGANKKLYEYLTGDSTKGFLLVGPYGTSKTSIIKTVKCIIECCTSLNVSFLSCPDIVNEIKKNDVTHFNRRPLIIDELGRGTKVINDYGTERHPMVEILTNRYNHKAWTFATSNYSPDDLTDIYGGYIGDRLKEMFELHELKGESFRI